MDILIPELSADLEWMLQSGQATSNMLAEALLKEYYVPVYRLMLSLLDDSKSVRQLTLKVFSTALMHVYRYRSEMGVDFWLYRFALEICRKAEWRLKLRRSLKSAPVRRTRPSIFEAPNPITPLDSELWLAVKAMKGEERLIVLLHYVHGWQVERIARLLKIREGVVHADLRNARLITEKVLEENGTQRAELGEAGVDSVLSGSLQRRWPEIQFSDDEFEKAFKEVTREVGRRGRMRQGTTRLKEVVLTGIGMVVAVALIYGVDRSLPTSDATQTSVVPVAVAQAATPEPQKALASPVRTPTIVPTHSPMDFFYIVQPGDTLKSVSRELEVPEDELRQANRLRVGALLKPGQALYVPPDNQPSDVLLPTSVPSPMVIPTKVQSDPLTPPYDLYSVLAKMQDFDWLHQTVWLDAQSLDLGPAGYIGPPKVRRIQTWLGQSRFLMLAGTLDGVINDVWLRTSGGLYRANPEVNVPWFFEASRTDMFQNSTVHDLFALFSDFTVNPDITGGLKFEVSGGDKVAGRQAVIVVRKDQQDQVRIRFWVDAQTGFLLRVQRMDDVNPEIIRNDIIVTSIAFNVNFPKDLFNPQLPWRGGFAQDSTGEPESSGSKQLAIPGRTPVPTNHTLPASDPSKSSLTFQYPLSFAEENPLALVEVLADNVYLGNIMFGNPWTMICGRSPDGNKVGFVSQPTLSPEQNAFFNWFSLSNKEKGEMTLGGLYTTSFAFAPDSRRLALFGFDGQFSEGGVYILDTETGKYNRLIWLLNARSLVWSPDGQSLALIGAENSLLNEETIVLNASTGEVIYRGPAATDNQPVASDAPIKNWGVQFPTKMGGLEACSAAPAK